VIKKYLSGSSNTVFIGLISLFFSFLLLKIQLGFLGVEQRGIMILAQANVAVLVSLVRFGISQSVIKAISEQEKSIVCANFIFLVAIQAVLIGLIVLLLFMNRSLFGGYLQNLSFFVITSFSISSLLFYALSSFSFLLHSSKVFIIQTVLFGVLNIGFLWLAGKCVTVGINMVLLCIAAAQFCVVIFLAKLLPRFRSCHINKQLLMQLVFGGARSIGWSFIKDLSYKIDLLFFGSILSKYDFGIYSILQNLCQSIWRITDQLMASYSKYLLGIKKEYYIKFTNNVILILTFLTFLAIGIAYFLIVPVFGFIAGMDLSQYRFPALVLLYAVFVFNIWKLVANFFIQIGHYFSMYFTLILLIGLFYILKKFAVTLDQAVSFTALVYSIISIIMIFLYIYVTRQNSFRNKYLN